MQNQELLQAIHSIYLSYHPADEDKATGLRRHLALLERESGVIVNSRRSILAGAHVETIIQDFIFNSDLIIVLCSANHLSEHIQEIEIIKSSSCFVNKRVIPVPVSQCRWQTIFPGLMPLPYDYNYRTPSSDENSFWYEVVQGMSNLVKSCQNSKQRHFTIIPARADSSSVDPSQEIPSFPSLNVIIKPDEFWVQISGDSMSPIFEEGDAAIAKRVEREELQLGIEKKKIFVVRTKTQGSFLKYIKSISSEKISLESQNSLHPIISLDLEEIDSIFIVVRSIKIRSEI